MSSSAARYCESVAAYGLAGFDEACSGLDDHHGMAVGTSLDRRTDDSQQGGGSALHLQHLRVVEARQTEQRHEHLDHLRQHL